MTPWFTVQSMESYFTTPWYSRSRARKVSQFSLAEYSCTRARSIGLIRIRRTPPFSDEAFDGAHPNPDESSELIRLIRKIHG